MSHHSTGKEREAQPPESILAQRFVEPILESAKQNLQRDGSLMPVLFIRWQGGESGVVPIELPDTTEEKYVYFGILGLAVLSMGKRLDEALFLSETWYVSTAEDPKLTLEVAPSQHPSRREAITLVGRNAKRTRFAFVVQPFYRDVKHQWVFEARAVEKYNVSSDTSMEAVGILDALFASRPTATE